MASNEGSILISCTTSLALGLIKPHVSLDNSSPRTNVISSSADQPRNDKSQFNVHMLWEKSKTKLKTSAKTISEVCSSDGQSKSNKEQFINICSNEQFNTTGTRNNGDKNYQAERSDM